MAVIDWSKKVTPAMKEAARIEQLAQAERSKRDSLLMAADKYMLPDFPSKPEGVEAYRQALRDLTGQAGFPENIDWPTLGGEHAND